MKKIHIAAVCALILALCAIISIERVPVGYVGVVYSPRGVEENPLSQGWHILSPMKNVKCFPVSQQQIVFSNDPADYNAKKHQDWHIDAPASGGMVSINMTVNYNFLADRVVDLYSRFNGMAGEDIVESRVQNSIIAYTKEVTAQYSVMDIYADKKAEVNQSLTQYLNEKLSAEYGINVSGALIIDVELDPSLAQKINAKDQAKQDAEIEELNRKTAIARAETNKANAQAAAEVEVIQAQAAADAKLIEANAEAEANRVIAASITPELIQMMEAQARQEHGWVTVQAGSVVSAIN